MVPLTLMRNKRKASTTGERGGVRNREIPYILPGKKRNASVGRFSERGSGRGGMGQT